MALHKRRHIFLKDFFFSVATFKNADEHVAYE